ncbi:phosphoglycolate phosphatase [Ruegeria marina]|uniref:Phosphoglycolate phosphatase n=1 Tax=Ruegeria marina TaxID=639004 RepID=A0A1G6LI49_9RHOB|nr:phosphoglycolate phosphatase [Ruegeria marina]SDC42863.1 phosphoglycolate phosphatase [Ruegeria marina]
MTAAIVFDLDGTLIDSAPDIAAAVNRMLAAEGHGPLDLATVTSFVGRGLPNLVAQVIGHLGLDMGRHPELAAATLAEYNRSNSSLTMPYPGAVGALERLREGGAALGICTNKPEGPARQVLADLGLSRFFDVVIGGDSLPTRKPDPAMLHASFAALPDLPRLYVGDSEVDAETALNAGVPFLLFTEGYRKRAVEELPHRAAFNAFADLPELVAQALAI